MSLFSWNSLYQVFAKSGAGKKLRIINFIITSKLKTRQSSISSEDGIPQKLTMRSCLQIRIKSC